MKNHIFIYAIVAVPLRPQNWQSFSYNDIPANELGKSKDYLEIIVDESGSPLVHKLSSPQWVKSVQLKAQLEGKLNYGDLSPGQKGADDFPLRIGLVIAGNKTLNRFQRWIASDWVLKLHELGDGNQGIDHILFLNVTSQKKAAFKKRVHPASDLFHEKIVGEFEEGVADINFQLDSPKPVLGIWVGSDGDETKSKYRVKINQLNLETRDE